MAFASKYLNPPFLALSHAIKLFLRTKILQHFGLVENQDFLYTSDLAQKQ